MPNLLWYAADIARLTTPADWRPLLENIDAVVNAAGALQNSCAGRCFGRPPPGDGRALRGLQRGRRAADLQISAVGVSPDADTDFLRTKAAMRRSRPRPRLGDRAAGPRDRRGPMAARRCARGLSGHHPLVLDSPVQTVAVEHRQCGGSRSSGVPCRISISSRIGRSRSPVVAAFRADRISARPCRRGAERARRRAEEVADGLGRLGWRSPFGRRRGALFAAGVVGDQDRDGERRRRPRPARGDAGTAVVERAGALVRPPLSAEGGDHRLPCRCSGSSPALSASRAFRRREVTAAASPPTWRMPPCSAARSRHRARPPFSSAAGRNRRCSA